MRLARFLRFVRLAGLASLACAAARALADPPPMVNAVDFAGLGRFAAANRELPPPGKDPRVVFLGDSITEAWTNASREYFARADRINRGIGGQTTAQMLLRFRADVVDLKPAVVVILAGTNDFAGNTGPTDLATIEGNFASMVDLARAHHIRVVLSSVLPVADYPWRPGLKPGPRIVALNDWLRECAREHHLVYVDYWTALNDGALGMRPEYAADGVHPTPEGYRVMLPLAEAGIAAALRAPPRR